MNKDELTNKEKTLIKRLTKAHDNYINLKDMDGNAMKIADSYKKMLAIVGRLQGVILCLNTEVVLLKDAGGKATNLLQQIGRKGRTQKKQAWERRYGPDVRN